MSLAPVIILADLGKLSKLPPELMLMVIDDLDLPSAAKFSQVNRQAQFLIWSDVDYRWLRACLFSSLNARRHMPDSVRKFDAAYKSTIGTEHCFRLPDGRLTRKFI
ncbi:hypothetical protein F5Y09DRAFT_309571 [Xylaria sp. FL1042]|nr:hypothetical protein F5Y09DRAFT_309571 [Xylaria sp. FL1042]